MSPELPGIEGAPKDIPKDVAMGLSKEVPGALPDHRIRTLLVDDAVPLRRLMRTMLEREGHFDVVGEAGNGMEGLQGAQDLKPELVLLDLSMPVMDGLEALPLLKQLGSRLVVVVLSGFEEVRMRAQAMALGASDYIEKGLRPAQTTARILSAYQRAKSAKPATFGGSGHTGPAVHRYTRSPPSALDASPFRHDRPGLSFT